MNKIGAVLGVAAVAVLAGCLDPNYQAPKKTVFGTGAPRSQDPVGAVETPVLPDQPPARPVVPVDGPRSVETTQIEVTDVPETPQVEIPEPTPVVTPPPATPVAQPETTVYIVQRGDTLSKISKRYNITQTAIKRANPKMKGDVVMLGQKLILPGKVEVGEQKVPEGAFARPPVRPAPAPAVPYTGATADYVIQKGDMLGTIARKHGCTVRQLKDLNGMTGDRVVIGKKIKVPAASAKKDSPAAVTKKSEEKAPKTHDVEPAIKSADSGAKAADAKAAVPDEAVEKDAANAAEPPVVAPAPAAQKYINYTVQEGDDLIGISINCDLTVSEIRQLNNLSDDAKVTPGMVLKLPADSVL